MLYICPTPIGNLADVTYRVIQTLKDVDLVACEDTRTTVKLLNHYEIKKPLFSYHEHNEQSATRILSDKLREGMNIALVSDAGMPGISDPGEVLIKACIEQNLPYTVLPGASAMVTALVASQLKTMPFHYEGFLDREKRKRRLEVLKHIESTMVFYESPHRIGKMLRDILEVFGDRPITLARELTKRYETLWHTTLAEATLHYESDETPVKGEFVVVVGGYIPVIESLEIEVLIGLVQDRIKSGERLKDAVKAVAKVNNADSKELYKIASQHKEIEG